MRRCAWWWWWWWSAVCFFKLSRPALRAPMGRSGRGQPKKRRPRRTSKPYMPPPSPKAEAVCQFNNLRTQKESEIDRGKKAVSVGMEFTRARAAAWCAGKGKPPPTGATGNGLPNNNCRYWFLAKPRFRLSSPFLSWLVPFQLSCQESNTAMLFKTHNLFSGFCVSNLSQKSGIFFRSRIVVFCCEIFSM